MRTKEAIKFFDGQTALANACGVSQPTVAGWGEFPPDIRQLQIQRLTRGKLKAEPAVLELVGPLQHIKGS